MVRVHKKTRLVDVKYQARLSRLTEQFTALHEYVPGLQANFVLGLDSDAGDQPFTLTRKFFTDLPFVWPNLNLLTPYGGTPIYDRLASENRLLRNMPLALYCSPYLCYVPRNYSPLEYYDKLIALFEASVSPSLVLRRALSRDHPVIKLSRCAQTVAVRRDIIEMRRIRAALRTDPHMQHFHSGQRSDLPAFYLAHVGRRLGRYGHLLSAEELRPTLPPSACRMSPAKAADHSLEVHTPTSDNVAAHGTDNLSFAHPSLP